MSNQTWTLRRGRLPRTLVREAAALAARSYENDAFFAHMFPSSRRRARSIAWVHRSVFSLHGPTTLCVSARDPSGELLGVALWLAPGGYPLPATAQLRQLPYGMLALWGHPHATSRGAAYQRELRLQHPREPHWYLWSLNVAPAAQGRGIGTALLREGLAMADRDQVGVHLETQDPTNISFYERFGFQRRFVIQPSPHGPPLFALWREPETNLELR